MDITAIKHAIKSVLLAMVVSGIDSTIDLDFVPLVGESASPVVSGCVALIGSFLVQRIELKEGNPS